MNSPHGTSLETRPSLLWRLRADDDSEGWQEFYRIYGGLIRFFAMKAGLTADETEEVVQETAIGVARRLPDFVYDPKVCRFKTWLLNLVRWRIQDQLRKRRREERLIGRVPTNADGRFALPASDAASTATIERVADPAVPEFGAEWDAAWEKHLTERALERVREQLDERQFQIFDLYALKGWSASQVAETLGISVARVYLARHRVAARLGSEVRKLERIGARSANSSEAK